MGRWPPAKLALDLLIGVSLGLLTLGLELNAFHALGAGARHGDGATARALLILDTPRLHLDATRMALQLIVEDDPNQVGHLIALLLQPASQRATFSFVLEEGAFSPSRAPFVKKPDSETEEEASFSSE